MPMAQPFGAALALCSSWCIIAALEVSAVSLPEKIFLFRLRLSFLPFVPLLVLEAYYRYAKGRKLLVRLAAVGGACCSGAQRAAGLVPGEALCL